MCKITQKWILIMLPYSNMNMKRTRLWCKRLKVNIEQIEKNEGS